MLARTGTGPGQHRGSAGGAPGERQDNTGGTLEQHRFDTRIRP